MKHPLENLEKLARLMHAVQRVKRHSRRPDEEQWTNTAEHTFELVMMCWYIIATQGLTLDLSKVLRYALAHDIVEAYAGDTFVHDLEARKTKAAREAAALARLEREFPEFGDMLATMHEYEARSTPEAKFVYAADKLIDPINMSLETKQSLWKEVGITWDMMIENKESKVATSDTIFEYWKQFIAKLKPRKKFFFEK